MEDSEINIHSWNESLNQRTINNSDSFNNTDNSDDGLSYPVVLALYLLNWITLCIGLLLTLVSIFAVLLLVKKDRGAPVCLFNLLISDVLQLCSRIPLILECKSDFPVYTLLFGIVASVGFMVCVSLERYLVIAKPLWFRFRRRNRTSLLVCVGVWILSLLLIVAFWTLEKDDTILAVFLLLPLPLFIFFLAGSIKALSEFRSVPADEKRRIVSVLVVVLLTYVLIFLHIIIYLMSGEGENLNISEIVFVICIFLSPLADSAIYILLRKSAVDKLLASLCCCKMSNNYKISSTCNDSMSAPCTTTV